MDGDDQAEDDRLAHLLEEAFVVVALEILARETVAKA